MTRFATGWMLAALGTLLCAPVLLEGQQASRAPQQPGTRLSIDALKQQMFRLSAGRRLKPASWPNGARVAVALSFDVDNATTSLRSGDLGSEPLSRGEYGAVDGLPRILRLLAKHDVPASFFVTGAMADNSSTDAGRRVLALIDAHPGQFTLGNHSYTHRDFRTLTAAEIRDELRRAETSLARYCRQDPRPIFRAPGGGTNAAVLAAVGAAGYRWTVGWDIDTIDWRPVANDPPGPTADQIVAKVLANARGGSIVLNHLGGYNTYAALPRVVQGLRDRGFDLVTLDDLLGT